MFSSFTWKGLSGQNSSLLPGSGRCLRSHHRSPGHWEPLWPSRTHWESVRRWRPATSSHLNISVSHHATLQPDQRQKKNPVPNKVQSAQQLARAPKVEGAPRDSWHGSIHQWEINWTAVATSLSLQNRQTKIEIIELSMLYNIQTFIFQKDFWIESSSWWECFYWAPQSV